MSGPSFPLQYNNDLTAVDPRIVALGGPKGARVTFVPLLGLPVVLLKTDYGITTNWIDISGGGAGTFWDTNGNPGSGLVLGTTSNDSWSFITNGLSRGGFRNTGESFLKTHQNFTDSEYVSLTSGISTVDNSFAPIFEFLVPDMRSGYLTVSVQGRKDTGDQFCAFERKCLFYREGGGAIVSQNIHFTFTDKTLAAYDIQIVANVNNVQINVRGESNHNVAWSGKLSYQLIGTP